MKATKSYLWPKGSEPTEPVAREALFASLPPEWPEMGLLAEIREAISRAGRKLVVLDDDPLGTQATHGVPVVLSGDEEALSAALQKDSATFYLITNSRSLPEGLARELYRDLARRLYRLGRRLGCELTLLCRSDSTLRGHFPAEVEALTAVHQEEFGCGYDGVLLAPFMQEGRRFTIGDVQWVEEKGFLIPAAQSEFARDPIFGYGHSRLPRWIEEKTGGRTKAEGVATIGLEEIRGGGPEKVAEILRRIEGARPVVVNAASYRDLEVAVAGLLRAEAAGREFLSWTAASFVRLRTGRASRPLLSPDEIYSHSPRPGHGLIVVGSFVERSTRQVERAKALPGLVSLEMEVDKVLDPASRRKEIERVKELAQEALAEGDVLIYTSRKQVSGRTWEESLHIGQEIQASLAELVRQLPPKALRFMVVKGGASAYALATQALEVKTAWALGQIEPGVPLWLLGKESGLPGLPYVVFPGNVGDDDCLARTLALLREEPLAEA